MSLSDKYLGWLDSNWHTALFTLRAAPESAALPTRAYCPHCNLNTLEVEQVLVAAGRLTHGRVYRIWTWCLKCEWSGDLLDLASQYWNLSRTDTAARFRELGFDVMMNENDQRVPGDVEFMGNRCKLFLALWKDAQDGMRSWEGNPDARTMLQHLDLSGSYPEEWDRGLGPCAAVTTAGHWGPLFLPLHTKDALKRVVLAVPYWLAPGLPAGLSLLRVRTKGHLRHQYFRLNRLMAGNAARSSRALLGAALLGNRSEWNPKATHVTVMTDLLSALQLSVRLRKQGTTVPPLLCIPSDQDGLPACIPANLIYGREATLTTSKVLTTNAVATAFDVQARLTTEFKTNRIGFTQFPDVEILELRNRSVSWNEALRRLTRYDSYEAIQARLAVLATSKHDLEVLSRSLSPSHRRIMTATDSRSKVALEGRLVEDQGTWIYDQKQLSPIIVRISRLRSHNRPKPHIIAAGNVIINGKKFPFQEDLAVLEERDFKWLRDFVMRSDEQDVPFVVSPPLSLVDAALSLYPPVKEAAAEYLGWNTDTNCWAFPQFSIERDGSRGPKKISPLMYGGHPVNTLTGYISSVQSIQDLLCVDYQELWSLVLAHLTCTMDAFFGAKPTLFTWEDTAAEDLASKLSSLGLKTPESACLYEEHWTGFLCQNQVLKLGTNFEDTGLTYRLESAQAWKASRSQMRTAGNVVLQILEYWMRHHPGTTVRHADPLYGALVLITAWMKENSLSPGKTLTQANSYWDRTG